MNFKTVNQHYSYITVYQNNTMACGHDYARKGLKAAGYLQVPNESWCLGIEHRNQQDVDKVVSSSTVLPLGYVARGHVFGALTYGTVAASYQDFIEDPDKTEFYYGHKNTPLDEQVRYIISNLRTGFSRVAFEGLFGVDCLASFWWAFSVLQKLGKVRVTALQIESEMSSSFDSVLYAKLFFSDETHRHLRVHYEGVYEETVDQAGQLEQHYERSF
jgi:coproporphyrinogen III oxidase-like Fe-S oxidoreductase